jgi:hypothetical protein
VLRGGSSSDTNKIDVFPIYKEECCPPLENIENVAKWVSYSNQYIELLSLVFGWLLYNNLSYHLTSFQ